jgi:hypothetical protein
VNLRTLIKTKTDSESVVWRFWKTSLFLPWGLFVCLWHGGDPLLDRAPTEVVGRGGKQGWWGCCVGRQYRGLLRTRLLRWLFLNDGRHRHEFEFEDQKCQTSSALAPNQHPRATKIWLALKLTSLNLPLQPSGPLEPPCAC